MSRYLLPDYENDPTLVDEFITPEVLAKALTMEEREDLLDNKWLALMELSPDVKFYYCMIYHQKPSEFVYPTFSKVVLPYSHVYR
jgi:hypothetical protein